MKYMKLATTLVLILGIITIAQLVVNRAHAVGPFPHVTVLRILGQDKRSNPTDYKTIRVGLESAAGDYLGGLFYIAKDMVQGTHPLYRLSRSGPTDHMDSTNPNEGAPVYESEQVLGYAWDTNFDDFGYITRFVNGFDHVTEEKFTGVPGYQEEGNLGFGHYLFGADFASGPSHSPRLVSASTPELNIDFDLSWGGSGYGLQWRGSEFINNWDPGRLINMALFYWPDAQTPYCGAGTCPGGLYNPTEGGDGKLHGSPVLEVTGGGNNLYTNTRPLMFDPYGDHTSNPDDEPAMWGGEFEKQVEIADMPTDDFVPVCWRSGISPWLPAYNYQEANWLSLFLNVDMVDQYWHWSRDKHLTDGDGFILLPMPQYNNFSGNWINLKSGDALFAATADGQYAIGIQGFANNAQGGMHNLDGVLTAHYGEKPVAMNGGQWTRRDLYLNVTHIDLPYRATASAELEENLKFERCSKWWDHGIYTEPPGNSGGGGQ